eukprot:6636875-Pyramimonas_sp.AAC.1
MGPSLGPLGPSWAPLGPSWGALRPSWGPVGGLWCRLGVVFGASWIVLERQKAEQARTPKSFANLRYINGLCLLGPSREAYWRHLVASWRPLGPYW